MLTKDIVCEMQVEAGELGIEHMGVAYAFCSEQCRERFEANPHLYVGLPGQKSPKQQGLSVIKQRHLKLDTPLAASEAEEVQQEILSMMGIVSLEIERDGVAITYDLLQATSEQIESRLLQVGIRLGSSLGERLRRAFIHYEEDCKVGNMEVQPCKHNHGH